MISAADDFGSIGRVHRSSFNNFQNNLFNIERKSSIGDEESVFSSSTNATIPSFESAQAEVSQKS